MTSTALVPTQSKKTTVARVHEARPTMTTIQWFWHADMNGEVTVPVGNRGQDWRNFWIRTHHYLHAMGRLPTVTLVRVEATY